METRKLGPLECLVSKGSAGAPALVALHGRGASGEDLADLGALVAPGFTHVFPHAPRPWPKDGPTYGLCWYDHGPERAAEIVESRGMLLATLAAVRAELGAPSLVLMGFSQGALMTLDAGLRAPYPATRLVALSGYLESDAGDASAPPTLVIHGTRDDVVPVEKGRDARDRLTRRGVPLTYEEYPIAHEISQAVARRVAAFIGEGAASMRSGA
jgi:phospholipase/carboxylesterase